MGAGRAKHRVEVVVSEMANSHARVSKSKG